MFYKKMAGAAGFNNENMIIRKKPESLEVYVRTYSDDIIEKTIDEFMEEHGFFSTNIIQKTVELRNSGLLLDSYLRDILTYKPHYTDIINEHGEEYERYKIHRRTSK